MSFLLMSKKSPGVYVNEVKSGSAPIAGVGTSTAAILFDDATFKVLRELKITKDKLAALPDGLKDRDIAYADDDARLRPNVPVSVTNYTEFKELAGGAYRRRLLAAQAALARDAQVATNPTYKALADALTALDAAQDATAFAAMHGFFLNGGTLCHLVVYDSIDAALEALQALDDVSSVLAPGGTGTDADKIVAHCASMGDRMAILDGPAGANVVDFGANPPAPATSEFAAYYYPRIRAPHPFNAKADPIVIPPSAHVAGVWARVDATRGVHKAPANVDIRGATGLEVLVSRSDQDGMNAIGVNAIREIQGAIRIYGARTLGGDANGEFKFINVQRTLAYLAKSIDQGIQWVVFEPNTPALWGKVTRNINAFLHGVWATGALFGATPEEAWYVRCDEALNPPGERDLGNLRVEIGVALVKPAEFVVINLTQWSGPAR